MNFWLWLIAGLVVVFAVAVWLIDAWQDRRPHGVDARDWQKVSTEKDDDFARRRTLGRATHSRTAPTTRVIR
jgi:hypothetical protein